MDQNGIRLMFSTFGVEARGQGFTLNDFFAFIRFQAMSDKNELIRALTHIYGENNLIERLTSESTKDLYNIIPSEKAYQLILLNGNDLIPALKELIGQVFDRCDIDRDGLLNHDEFNEYFKIIGMEPVSISIQFILNHKKNYEIIIKIIYIHKHYEIIIKIIYCEHNRYFI